ncbi:MAG: hypothetical protein ABJC79_06875 [Acidimicrobiia bacterium]
MKFSDMMGKGPKAADETETALPPAQVKAPPVPEAPARFTAAPVDAAPVAVTTPDTAPVVPVAVSPPAPPAILDVMAELAPRRAEATDGQLDASAWLEGLTAIDDDLLPS